MNLIKKSLEVRETTMYDKPEPDLAGDRKTALFLIISDTDAAFKFLVNMTCASCIKVSWYLMEAV